MALVRRLILPMCLALIMGLLTLVVPLRGDDSTTIEYLNGQWVCSDGTKLVLIEDPGIPVEFQTPDFLVMPYEKYLKLSEEGKPMIKATKFLCATNDTGDLPAIMVVEPKLIIREYPISGSLPPGYYHRYGKFCSCIQIEVKVTWTPGDQLLGIAIADATTGEGYGRWYSGGSAIAVFSTDSTKCYYIYILNYSGNTKTIAYSGVIRLYVW
ncbi:MAG: hypothetical protein QXI36_00020 [Candidatus Bathyarchaeia archaeon]